jgi:hypothetical protein
LFPGLGFGGHASSPVARARAAGVVPVSGKWVAIPVLRFNVIDCTAAWVKESG